MLIDDFLNEALSSSFGYKRRGGSDRVVGGTSVAGVARDVLDLQTCLRSSTVVRMENSGEVLQS